MFQQPTSREKKMSALAITKNLRGGVELKRVKKERGESTKTGLWQNFKGYRKNCHNVLKKGKEGVKKLKTGGDHSGGERALNARHR